MRLEMGLCWCEVLIKGVRAKGLLRKLAPFGAGIAFTGSIGGILFQSRYVDAAPCCEKPNVVTSTSSSKATKNSKNLRRNIQTLKETGGRKRSPVNNPNLRFHKDYAEEKPLLSSVSPPEYNHENALPTKTLWTSTDDVRPLKNEQHSSASPGILEQLPALEPDSLSCLTQKVAWQPSSECGQDPNPTSVSKTGVGILGKQGHVNQASLIGGQGFSPVFLPSVSPTELTLVRSDSFTQKTILQAQNPNVPPPFPPQILQPNPNRDPFLQPPPGPAPIIPNSNQPSESSPTPRLEIPDSNSPIPSAPSPTLEIPEPGSPVQPSPTPTAEPTQTPEPAQPSPTPTPTTEPSLEKIQVQQIKVTGSTVFSAKELNPIVQPYEGQTLTLEQLREVADKITQLYLDRGYITSRAILADQQPAEGVVQIAVIEGSLQEIQVEGTRRVNASYIRSRVQLGTGKPLNTGKLEDQLRLLRADPLFENVEASLRAGTDIGKSILIVRVVEADPFEGSVSIDNYSPPSVGSERLGLNLLYRNLTGFGDEISASYYHTTTSGADSFDFSYRIPINAMNGTLQLRAAPSRNKITQEPLSSFGIGGESELYEISFRQPLIRSPKQEFALSLGFTYQEGQTFLLGSPFPFGIGPDENGNSSTRVIKFGQDYLRRDVKGAWSLRSLFSFGIDAFGATINSEPIPDGRFVSWLGQIQRVQILNENNFLIVGADIQLTPNSLLPSQQFVIGGGQSLRGYRQNIRSGDNGVRFSLEDRITLQRNESGASIFQVAPFFDAGIVWNKSDNPNNEFLPSQRFLAGVGLGIIWEVQPGLSLRVDYGYPLVKIDDKGTNAQDEGFYFSVRYQF